MNEIFDFVFPPLCLHCQKKVRTQTLFCEECTPFFDLIEPLERCPYCFLESPQGKSCKSCREKKGNTRKSAALIQRGPVYTLITRLRQGGMPYLAKTAASFMALQWAKLNWPKPDLIVFPQTSFVGHFLLGKKTNALLGLELGIFLNCKVQKCKKRAVTDKTILIVNDVMQASELEKALQMASQGHPKKVYSLSLAQIEEGGATCT